MMMTIVRLVDSNERGQREEVLEGSPQPPPSFIRQATDVNVC